MELVLEGEWLVKAFLEIILCDGAETSLVKVQEERVQFDLGKLLETQLDYFIEFNDVHLTVGVVVHGFEYRVN